MAGIDMDWDNNDDIDDTCLHAAVRNGDTEMVQKHLSRQVDVNAVNTDGDSALHIACRQTSKEIVELLLNSNADITLTNMEGHTPMHAAAENENPEVMSLMLIMWNILDNNITEMYPITSGLFTTPLHIACENGNTAVVKVLLEKGIDIDSIDSCGKTSIFYACATGCDELIKLLLNKGATTTITDNVGQTAFHIATFCSKLNALKLLLENNAELINLIDSNSESALHIAVQNSSIEVICHLLQKIADITRKNNEGNTPFHLVCAKNMRKAQYFFKHPNIDNAISIRNNKGKTAFRIACENECIDIVKRFLGNFQNMITERYENGKNILHLICEYGKMNCLRTIYESRQLTQEDLQCRDDLNRTPLHWAALHGCNNVVCFLLGKRIDPTLQDINGDTPLHLACIEGYVEVIRILIKTNCNLILNNEGYLPIYTVIKYGHYDALNELLNKYNLEQWHLKLASSIGHMHIFEYLKTKDSRNILNNIFTDIVYKAVDGGRVGIVKYLLGMANIDNIHNEQEKTLFHIAAEKGNYLTFDLLYKGYNRELLNKQTNDDKQNTSLHLALLSFSVDIALKLQYNSTRNNNGDTPKMLNDRHNIGMPWMDFDD